MTGNETRSRVAVVTGGSSGIGREVARLLVGRGYDVVLTARRPDPLRAAAGQIGARWVAGDTAVPEQWGAVVEAAGTVDLGVHAAGVMDGTFVRKERLASFEAVVRTNPTSAFVVAHGALPAMGPGGRFVFLSSSSSHAPSRGGRPTRRPRRGSTPSRARWPRRSPVPRAPSPSPGSGVCHQQ